MVPRVQSEQPFERRDRLTLLALALAHSFFLAIPALLEGSQPTQRNACQKYAILVKVASVASEVAVRRRPRPDHERSHEAGPRRHMRRARRWLFDNRKRVCGGRPSLLPCRCPCGQG